jgi:hypothetical protein
MQLPGLVSGLCIVWSLLETLNPLLNAGIQYCPLLIHFRLLEHMHDIVHLDDPKVKLLVSQYGCHKSP